MNKCHICEKKLKLSSSIHGHCRCDHVFCRKHLITHQCSFDYKKMEQQKLMKNNPRIICNKINKI